MRRALVLLGRARDYLRPARLSALPGLARQRRPVGEEVASLYDWIDELERQLDGRALDAPGLSEQMLEARAEIERAHRAVWVR